MRYNQSEKMQIIRLVEESPVSIKQPLLELNINRGKFYKWYRRHQEGGFGVLANRYRPWKSSVWCRQLLTTRKNHPVNWSGTLQIPTGIIFLNQRYTGIHSCNGTG